MRHLDQGVPKSPPTGAVAPVVMAITTPSSARDLSSIVVRRGDPEQLLVAHLRQRGIALRRRQQAGRGQFFAQPWRDAAGDGLEHRLDVVVAPVRDQSVVDPRDEIAVDLLCGFGDWLGDSAEFRRLGGFALPFWNLLLQAEVGEARGDARSEALRVSRAAR